MIIGFTKQMHTFVIGQPKKNINAQTRKIDGYIYSFITNVNQTDISFGGLYDVITEMLILAGVDLETVKDMEISLDIPSGMYSVRFWAVENLVYNAYCVNAQWGVQSASGDDLGNFDVFPWEYINSGAYGVFLMVKSVSLEDVERLTEGEFETEKPEAPASEQEQTVPTYSEASAYHQNTIKQMYCLDNGIPKDRYEIVDSGDYTRDGMRVIDLILGNENEVFGVSYQILPDKFIFLSRFEI